jgi:hypothetical protein
MAGKVQRNDPCPCGSGTKYKKCCLSADQESAPKLVLPAGAELDEAAFQLDPELCEFCGEDHPPHDEDEDELLDGTAAARACRACFAARGRTSRASASTRSGGLAVGPRG